MIARNGLTNVRHPFLPILTTSDKSNVPKRDPTFRNVQFMTTNSKDRPAFNSLAELACVEMILQLARPAKQVLVDHRSDLANHGHHRISDLHQIDLIGNTV